nr:hypothetical protein Itr_chr15CG10160 [Ipomoea trifida]
MPPEKGRRRRRPSLLVRPCFAEETGEKKGVAAAHKREEKKGVAVAHRREEKRMPKLLCRREGSQRCYWPN